MILVTGVRMDWNEEAIARLRSMWADGLTTAEIGRRLGVTKNAVVGKSHRLLLPPRPSPIRRLPAGETPRPQARRTVGPTLPPLHNTLRAPVPAAVSTASVSVRASLASAAAAPRPPALRAVPSMAGNRITTCCWPLGEPGTPSFHFCDDAAQANKPYCGAHAALAYVKVRDRREDAA